MKQENPILIEVKRGTHIESAHRGAIVVVNSKKEIITSIGNINWKIFPRSAVKALQALPMLVNGASDSFNFTEAELALTVSSHSGEPEHVNLAGAMLDKINCDETRLECGVQWPMQESVARRLAASQQLPTVLHSPCSGKHIGFLCLAQHLKIDSKGYVEFDHPIQAVIRQTLQEFTEFPHGSDNVAIDGCSIPTYQVPLQNLAYAFAKFGTENSLPDHYINATKNIRKAVGNYPFFVAGSHRFDTLMMDKFKERLFIKVGAEGVYCASIPELGYGVAIKCEDGANRACEVMMAAAIQQLLPLSSEEKSFLHAFLRPPIKNWRGKVVGEIVPSTNLQLK